MPANIFAPMVQVLSQNVGLASFVTLGTEEDDRNPRLILEQPRVFTEDAQKTAITARREQARYFLAWKCKSLFNEHSARQSCNLILPHDNVSLLITLASGFSNVITFLFVFDSLTHPPSSVQTPSCFTHSLHPGDLLGLLSTPALSALALSS